MAPGLRRPASLYKGSYGEISGVEVSSGGTPRPPIGSFSGFKSRILLRAVWSSDSDDCEVVPELSSSFSPSMSEELCPNRRRIHLQNSVALRAHIHQSKVAPADVASHRLLM